MFFPMPIGLENRFLASGLPESLVKLQALSETMAEELLTPFFLYFSLTSLFFRFVTQMALFRERC